MATGFALISSSPQIATFLPSSSSSTFHSKSFLPLPTRTLATYPIIIPSKNFTFFHHPPHLIPLRDTKRLGSIHAAAEDVVAPLDSAAVDSTQQMVSTPDDGVTNIISILLFVAFIGLSILTIGKREKDKFEKEEAANRSGKKKKKKVVRARAGPRGFGQKIDEVVDDD